MNSEKLRGHFGHLAKEATRTEQGTAAETEQEQGNLLSSLSVIFFLLLAQPQPQPFSCITVGSVKELNHGRVK